MNAAETRTAIADLRAPKAHMIVALTNLGAKRLGRSDRFALPSGTEVVVYKRGTNSYALSITNDLTAFWANSIVESVLSDYRAGNVIEVFA